MQNAQLTRARNYNDTIQHLDVRPPEDAPEWTCVGQEDQANDSTLYDTDIRYESIYDDYMHDLDVTMEESHQQADD